MLTVADKVRTILVEQLGVNEEEVTPQANLVEDLAADSLDCVEIVMECEDKFGIEIPDEDADPIRTVQQMVDYLEKRLTKVPAQA